MSHRRRPNSRTGHRIQQPTAEGLPSMDQLMIAGKAALVGLNELLGYAQAKPSPSQDDLHALTRTGNALQELAIYIDRNAHQLSTWERSQLPQFRDEYDEQLRLTGAYVAEQTLRIFARGM